MSNIDWLKCHEYACNSLVKTICDYWRNGVKDINNIKEFINMSRDGVRKYLKQGVILGWCDYNPEVERVKNLKSMTIKSKKKSSKKVLCIETDTVYNSISEAIKNVKGTSSRISLCCENKQEYCGKLEDGTKLHWKYAT